jgi:uncharacterized membrane protein
MSMWSSHAGRGAYAAVGLLAVTVVVGLIALWPDGRGSGPPQTAPQGYEATVMAVRAVPCPNPAQRSCSSAEARFNEGPRRGQTGTFDATTAGDGAAVGVGDKVFLAANELPTGEPVQGMDPYSLTGYQRHGPLLALALVFVGFVVLLGRGRGVLALIGLAISLLVVVKFVVPAMLDGRPPVLVAALGALAVMIVTIGLCHGLGPQSVAAILGTTVSLAVSMGLAAGFIGLANINGVSSEESQLVSRVGATFRCTA